ncbi:hypothetical protein [Ornithinimicrobium kibberense]
MPQQVDHRGVRMPVVSRQGSQQSVAHVTLRVVHTADRQLYPVLQV